MEIYLMNLKFVFIVLLCLTFAVRNDSIEMPKPSLKTVDSDENRQVIPEKIFGAQIHYSRIPHQYWEHRLQMIKAMGFNSLSVYIMWNFHQVQKGKFDYQNGDKNLRGFLQLSKKYGFNVLFRPGPYVCAQWDFGGLPVRLLSNKEVKLRTNSKAFLQQVAVYFASLAHIIDEYSYKNEGNIIMLQIQNQYGSYGADKSYIQAIRGLWRDLKVDLPQYYVDTFRDIQKCHWEGANIGINNGIKQDQWVKTRKMEPKGYLLGGEIYSGWLTHWGQKWQGKTLKQYTNEFNFLMSNNHSFSMYMAHGGSNFALTAGANGFQNKSFDYGGHVTSYDYDAPINEQGSPNSKFYAFRELAKKHASWQIPQVPQSLKAISIAAFIPSGFADLLQNLPKPTITSTKELILFQDQRLGMWNQGFVGYKTQLKMGSYQFNLVVHDFALVYLNGEFVEALDRGQKTQHTMKIKTDQDVNTLMILVESMGHINFGKQMPSDYKGITSFKASFVPHQKAGLGDMPQTLQGLKEPTLQMSSEDFSWDIYTIPIDKDMLEWKNKSQKAHFPRLFRYNLTLQQTGDTYLNMNDWQKGYIFVNGYNLGRYWNKGPQQKVFLPGVWLKKGANDIVVLQLLISKAKFIKGQQNLLVGNQKIDYTQHISPDIHLLFDVQTQ